MALQLVPLGTLLPHIRVPVLQATHLPSLHTECLEDDDQITTPISPRPKADWTQTPCSRRCCFTQHARRCSSSRRGAPTRQPIQSFLFWETHQTDARRVAACYIAPRLPSFGGPRYVVKCEYLWSLHGALRSPEVLDALKRMDFDNVINEDAKKSLTSCAGLESCRGHCYTILPWQRDVAHAAA